MHRLVLVFAMVVALTPTSASACPASANPCMKYRTFDRPPQAYVHTIKADIPSWDDARIARFLSRGSWSPVYHRKPLSGRTVLPSPITFRTADKADAYEGTNRLVIVRRLERQRSVRLVEIDGVPWKLQPCTSNKAFACLVPAGTMTFSEVE